MMFAALSKAIRCAFPWMLAAVLVLALAPVQVLAVEANPSPDGALAEPSSEGVTPEGPSADESAGSAAAPAETEQGGEADGEDGSSDPSEGSDQDVEDEGPVSASGRLGSYYPWTLEDGVLTISSPNIPSTTSHVLKHSDPIEYLDEAYRDHITSAQIVGPLATSVGELFRELPNLKSVEGLRYVQFRSYVNTSTGRRIQPVADLLFYGCTSLETVDIEDLRTGSVMSMGRLFQGCSSLKSLDVSGLDTSSARSLEYMFADCASLEELDLRDFDLSRVMWGSYANGSETCNAYSIGWMFQGCASLRRVDMSGLALSSNNYFHLLFDGCSSLEEVSLFSFTATEETPEAAAGFMFYGCASLKSVDLSMLDTGALLHGEDDIYVKSLFYGCSSLEEVTVGPSSIVQMGLPGELWENEEGVRFAPADIPVDEAGVYTRVWPDDLTVRIHPLEASFLAVGTSYQLVADVHPADRAGDLAWTSSDETVATVDETGLLTAQAPGITKITASVGEVSDALQVEVRLCVRSVKMSERSKTVELRDGAFALEAIAEPPDAYNAALGWSSTDPLVATVDATGVVTPHAEGSAVITASAGGFSDSCMLTVEDPESEGPEEVIEATSLTLDRARLELVGAKTEQLKATILPENATHKTVIWTSTDPSVARVGAAGSVTAVGKGTAFVHATSGDGAQSAACEVLVTNPVTALEAAPSVKTVEAGESFSLSLHARGELPGAVDALGVPMWTVSDEDVLEVVPAGDAAQIKAKAPGSADVIVSMDGLQAACTVTVKAALPVPPEAQPPDQVPVEGGASGNGSGDGGSDDEGSGDEGFGDGGGGSASQVGQESPQGASQANVAVAAGSTALPQTGDEDLLPLWLLLVAACAATAACHLFMRRIE